MISLSLGLGLGLFLSGFIHRIFPLTEREWEIVRRLQAAARSLNGVGFFQKIWFFGRTTFALAALSGLTLVKWKAGLAAFSAFGFIVGLEYLLKGSIERERPFQTSGQIAMLQPEEPQDASFPSGDTLRIWYVALILGTILGTPSFWIGAILLALSVTLGRMVLGVHYPSDVLTGAGLGLMGASLAAWLWQVYNLI